MLVKKKQQQHFFLFSAISRYIFAVKGIYFFISIITFCSKISCRKEVSWLVYFYLFIFKLGIIFFCGETPRNFAVKRRESSPYSFFCAVSLFSRLNAEKSLKRNFTLFLLFVLFSATLYIYRLPSSRRRGSAVAQW